MADSNPANFANLPKDELREIAAKGGHASHGSDNKAEVSRSTTVIVLTYVLTQPSGPARPQPRWHLH
jgi:hypothetical protein